MMIHLFYTTFLLFTVFGTLANNIPVDEAVACIKQLPHNPTTLQETVCTDQIANLSPANQRILLNKEDAEKNTMLHVAAEKRADNTYNQLIRIGAAVNTKNKQGKSAREIRLQKK